MSQATVDPTDQQEFSDADWRVVDNADQSKKLAFQISGLTTATTRTATWPDKDGTVAMTSDITSTTAATQAEQETGSSTTVMVTPGRQQYHPSAAKAWFKSTGTSSQTLQVNYNITSLSDDGVGLVGVTIATDFSSTNYAICASVQSSTFSGGVVGCVAGASADKPAAGTCQIAILSGSTATDPTAAGGGSPIAGLHCIMFGDQA